MSDPDELERLRRRDPVDQASLPSPADPSARALFEEITMTDTSTSTSEAIPQPTPRGPNRRRIAVAAFAAATVLALGVAAVNVVSDDDTGRRAPDAAVPGPANQGISPGGASASCVEFYDQTSLARRQTAFDGTVTRVSGDSVTFDVGHWYRGGTERSVTLRGAATLGGVTSAGSSVGLTPGARLLVAGDGGFAWPCGFTRPYDADTAKQWATVFGS